MVSQVHVHSSNRTTSQERFRVTPAVKGDQEVRPWQFVSEFQQLMGDGSDPDPLFFVESWTLGMQEALENLQRRRQAQGFRKPESQIDGLNHPSPLSFVADETDADFLNIGGAFAAARGYEAAQPRKRNGQLDACLESLEELEWKALAEEYDRVGDLSVPMTENRAYGLLGVSPTSSFPEIKAAYRHKVSQWHPDHLQGRNEKERKIATRQMAQINDAYHLLRSCLLQKTA